MKDVEQAYLAGLFDGEGCAYIHYGKYKRKGRSRLYEGFKVQLIISNDDIRVLRETRVLFNLGRVFLKDSSFRISKPKDILNAIELINPYIRVKKPNLTNLQEACKYVLKVRGTGKRHRWTEEEKDEFLKLEETSKVLTGPRKKLV